MRTGRIPRAAIERFNERYIPVPESGCWIWLGNPNAYGYGVIRVSGKMINAHRFAYTTHRGPIPDGLTLDHLCRVRCCVNPDHLEAVDNKTNVLRGVGSPAVNARKTHCLRGHEFTNTTHGTTGVPRRYCQTCINMHSIIYKRCKRDAERLWH